MRPTLRASLILLAFASLSVLHSPAQTACCCNCPITPHHVQPYTAKQEVTRTQTLANGTIIHTVEEVTIARDAEGRTYRDSTRTTNGEPVQFIQVFDYPTQSRYTWTTGQGYPEIVTVYHARPNTSTVQPQAASRYYPWHIESLPPQTIAGVYVEGTRTTRTIPAGYEGNDHDLVSTTEYWNAARLGLALRTSIDDPRTGKTTTDTTELKQADPDPSLFKPPAGYQIREATQ
jgi:hypothetical protein